MGVEAGDLPRSQDLADLGSNRGTTAVHGLIDGFVLFDVLEVFVQGGVPEKTATTGIGSPRQIFVDPSV